MSDAAFIVEFLRKHAEQIANAGHAGWGNLNIQAADLIEQQVADIDRLTGWQPAQTRTLTERHQVDCAAVAGRLEESVLCGRVPADSDIRDAIDALRAANPTGKAEDAGLIRALQKALAYWMPKVFDERSAHDAYLLVGYDGEDEQGCWGDEMVAALPQWTPVTEHLPAEPGWYLVMLEPDNEWCLISDTPLQVEFDAYKSKPQTFTCLYDYRQDEDITAAVTHWMSMPSAPAATMTAAQPASGSDHD